MTYGARGRSLSEIVVAVIFVSFMTGFVAVLCIGNYYRAKRAQERQRQKRLARLAGGHGLIDSPRSYRSGSSSTPSQASDPSHPGERQHLLGGGRQARGGHTGPSERRRYPANVEPDLLLQVSETPGPRVMSV